MTATDFVHSPWIPEDDLLLKNSIEDGASLAALAKGAVKFSRRFTFREIRDRWHSLLYDPDVSTQASAYMFELELSGSNPPSKSALDNLKGGEKVPEKRKNRSIRRHYYTMRKRIKNDFFSSQNVGFFEEPNLHSYNHQEVQECKFQDHVTTHGDDVFAGKQHLNSPISDGSASFHTIGGFPSPSTRLPLWKTMEDIPAPDMPVDENNAESHLVVEEALALHNDKSLPEFDGAHLVSLLGDRPHELINCIEYTDSLLNFSNEDDILLMDADAKDAMHGAIQEVDLCDAGVVTSSIESPNLEILSNQCPEESKDSSFNSDQHVVCHQELTEGNIVCTINTEDPDIPCNDDIFLLIHPSTQFAPSIGPQIVMDSVGTLSPSSHEKDGDQGLITATKGKDPSSFTQSITAGPTALPEVVSPLSPAGSAFKSEPPDGEYQVPLLENCNDLRNPSQNMLHTPLEISGNGMLVEDANKVELRGLSSSAMYTEMSLPLEVDSVKMTALESMGDPYISENNSDSDGDIPYFSDVEAMILEMDLVNGQESSITSDIAKYQNEDAKRMIMKLEQAARSSFQRVMSSQGALAIFYSRRLTHYIKKAEVTIGRSTDDTEVDIDLRKEGRANKISRRQAIIKMETDGSFSIKNLGASSILLNGKEVAHGEVVALASRSLIEIRGMSFAFDINDKYVKRFLGNKLS